MTVFAQKDDTTKVSDGPKACNQGRGLCVPYYLCNDAKNTDEHIFDIANPEIFECQDYFDVCCSAKHVS